jgi:hypothetical protein
VISCVKSENEKESTVLLTLPDSMFAFLHVLTSGPGFATSPKSFRGDNFMGSLSCGIDQSVQRWAMDWSAGVQFPVGARDFLFSTESRPALGPPQLPIKWVPGSLSPGVKRQVREDDHSPLSSVGVKNGENISPLLHLSSWRGV